MSKGIKALLKFWAMVAGVIAYSCVGIYCGNKYNIPGELIFVILPGLVGASYLLYLLEEVQ